MAVNRPARQKKSRSGAVTGAEAAGQQVGQPARGQFEHNDQKRQDQGKKGQQAAGQPGELGPPLAGVFGEHGHQRRTQHASDQEVIDEGGELRRHAKGAHGAAGPKERRNHHLAQQPEEPAGQAAGSQQPGAARQAAAGGRR
jgi:hypothetical protein